MTKYSETAIMHRFIQKPIPVLYIPLPVIMVASYTDNYKRKIWKRDTSPGDMAVIDFQIIKKGDISRLETIRRFYLEAFNWLNQDNREP